MNKILSVLTCAFILSASAVFSADKVTIQLKWVTQAQFAGYYVAKDKGFYDAEGLDVTIKPGGPDIAPAQVLAGGGADVMVDWMPSALAAREKGLPLVNIAQPFKSSGMMLTCRKDMGVNTTADLKGKTLGVWFYGNEYPFLSWMSRLGLKTDGSANGVTVLRQGWGVEPLTEGQAACVSTMSYNEYWVVRDAGYSPEQLTVFKYQSEGAATLDEARYVEPKVRGTQPDQSAYRRTPLHGQPLPQRAPILLVRRPELAPIRFRRAQTGITRMSTSFMLRRNWGRLYALFMENK